MRQALMITAALGLLTIGAHAAHAQQVDKNGRCHDAAGKLTKDEVCVIRGSISAPPKGFHLDAKGNCLDVNGGPANKGQCKPRPGSAARGSKN